MKFLDQIKEWSVRKKKIFSITLAVFFTVLIIILNSGINLIWKDETQNRNSAANNPINSIEESFSKIFNQIKPVLDQTFSGSTTEKIIDQINSASSSFSTTSN